MGKPGEGLIEGKCMGRNMSECYRRRKEAAGTLPSPPSRTVALPRGTAPAFSHPKKFACALSPTYNSLSFLHLSFKAKASRPALSLPQLPNLRKVDPKFKALKLLSGSRDSNSLACSTILHSEKKAEELIAGSIINLKFYPFA